MTKTKSRIRELFAHVFQRQMLTLCEGVSAGRAHFRSAISTAQCAPRHMSIRSAHAIHISTNPRSEALSTAKQGVACLHESRRRLVHRCRGSHHRLRWRGSASRSADRSRRICGFGHSVSCPRAGCRSVASTRARPSSLARARPLGGVSVSSKPASGPTVIAHQLPVALLLRVTPCRAPSGSGFSKPARMLASRVIRRPL
jgi:hypothetical protein